MKKIYTFLLTCITISAALSMSAQCPTTIIVTEQSGCGLYQLHLNEFGETGNIIWTYDGLPLATGTNNVLWGSDISGNHVVCAQAWTASCPNLVTICQDINVPMCPMDECPTSLVAQAIDCNSYVFHIEGVDIGEVSWNFGDQNESQSGANSDHTYAANGIYDVVAHYFGPSCPNGAWIIETIEVNCFETPVCPETISANAGDNCGVMNFEISSFVEGEAVTWFPGDDTGPVEGGHYLSHTYAAHGVYNVCAFYTSPSCPDGVELCTEIEVAPCNVVDCPTNIIAEQIDCDSYIFHIDGVNNGNVIWSFGDGGTETSGVAADHTFADNGYYIVTAIYSGPNCPNQTYLVLTVGVQCSNGVDCPTEIFSIAGNDCGVMNFEIGNFVEGEVVNWYPGDESGVVETGHFFSHTYAQPGYYQVCAFYTSPACPNGVELCTDIVVLPCDVCPTEILAQHFGCGSYGFYLNGTAANDVLWSFGDGVTETSGITSDHYYAENGVYIVTVQFTSSNCPQITTLVYTINVDCHSELGCPESISHNAGGDCGVMNFEIGSFVEGEAVTWFPGDETGAVQTGHFFSHIYAAPGSYNVCAFYTSPACPNGVELCTTIEVLPCNVNDCPTYIVAEQVDCNSFVFHVDGVTAGDVVWTFGDESGENSGVGADHSYDQNGVYIITAQYFGANCQSGVTLIYTVQVNCQTGAGCPEEIWSGAGNDCGVMNFEIGSFVEGEAVTWYPGDETGAVETGHFFSHIYAEPGVYNVCAFYTSPGCPDGVELCTTIEVLPCNISDCPTFLIAEQVDCNSYVFHVDGVDTGNVVWHFGDDNTETSGVGADHSYAQNGVYVITAQYFGPNCQTGVTLSNTIEVNCQSGTECPQEIWHWAGVDCGEMNFQIGNFVQGQVVTWHPGDESGAVESENVFSHTYAEPGIYTLCAFYISPLCPDGVELCTTFVVAPCNTECSDVVFGIDSYVNNGGTPSLYYSVVNAETNEMVLFGESNYTSEDPFFDTSICLPDGCYILTIDNNNMIQLGQGLNVFITMGNQNLAENAEIIYQDNVSFSMQFGVNSDCTASPACIASFEAHYTNAPGHIEFINNSTYDGTATFAWDYGNGTSSDGQSGNVWYEQNGIYTVCLTITTDNCQDTYCFPVSIQELETVCEANLVTLTVTAAYPNDLTELVDLALTFEGIELNSWSLPMFSGFTTTMEVCVPDGCYELDLTTELPSIADMVNASISVNGETIDVLEFINGNTESHIQFGLNSDCTVRVPEMLVPEWNLYPNPATEKITLQTSDGSKLGQISVFDVMGNLVLNLQPFQTSIFSLDLTSLSSGIYILKLSNENTTQIKRFELVR